MVWKKSLLFVLSLTMIFLSGCEEKLPEGNPDIGIPKEEMNTRIRLSLLDLTNGNNGRTKNRGGILIDVVVITSDHIAFAQDYGARIFIYEENQWVEIENRATYSESVPKTVILPPDEETTLQSGTAGLSPYKQDLNKEVPLRIILVGNIIRDGKITEEKTAGSIDLTLQP